MTEKSTTNATQTPPNAVATATEDETERLGTDDVFHLLQNQRRRRTLRYLRDNDDGDGVDMRDVVEWVAAEEHDTTVQELRSKERQRVYIALYQAHLPKLDKLGIVDYDKRKGWVELREKADIVMPYLNVDDESSAVETDAGASPRPTPFTYLALGFAALLVALALADASPVANLPTAAVEVAVLLAFAATTLGDRLHVVTTR